MHIDSCKNRRRWRSPLPLPTDDEKKCTCNAQVQHIWPVVVTQETAFVVVVLVKSIAALLLAAYGLFQCGNANET